VSLDRRITLTRETLRQMKNAKEQGAKAWDSEPTKSKRGALLGIDEAIDLYTSSLERLEAKKKEQEERKRKKKE